MNQYIELESWAKKIFPEYRPNRNTLINMNKKGLIQPPLVKVGTKVMVTTTAEIISPEPEPEDKTHEITDATVAKIFHST